MGTKTVNECTNPGIPVPASDALTDVLREGARRMLREAVEAEVQEFLTHHVSNDCPMDFHWTVRNA